MLPGKGGMNAGSRPWSLSGSLSKSLSSFLVLHKRIEDILSENERQS